MLDNKRIRRDLEGVIDNLARRGFEFDRRGYLELEGQRRDLQVRIDALHALRNKLSKAIRTCASSERSELIERAGAIKEELPSLESRFEAVQTRLQQFLLDLPNLVHDQVPDGAGEEDNQVVRRVGSIPGFDFKPKNHFELSATQMDFAAASRVSGARFVVLKGEMARLHRALSQWMLDIHVERHDYQEVYVPLIVDGSSLVGTGQLPKFAHDLYRIDSDQEQYLIPTAEVPLTNLARDQVLREDRLPIRYAAHTPCFRSEAGSYGKDTAGMIRQHQFEKVELVQICHPDSARQNLIELLGHAESILQDLELAYQVVHLCAGDTGFASADTFDLEVWLPGQSRYREISSCSHFTDFQARRAGIRFRDKQGMIHLAHTINGSGLAVGRTLVAILENNQTEDGRVSIPKVIQPYLKGQVEMKLS